jgi:predicted aspartyl protease
MVTLLMSLAVSACAAPPHGSKSLSFELRDNAIVVSVLVERQGPFRFLLDTGASQTTMSTAVARRVGASVTSRTLVVTPVGSMVRPVATIALHVGSLRPMLVNATIVSVPELARGGLEVDGIVGQDVLAPLVYTIDYTARTIAWESDAGAGAATRLKLEFAGGQALMTLPPHGDDVEPLRLIPDTGADRIVLFARRGRALPALTLREVGVLRTLAGQQLVRRAFLDRLDVGGFALEQHEAVVLGRGQQGFPPGDGLLPLHLFSRVIINGREGYIALVR